MREAEGSLLTAKENILCYIVNCKGILDSDLAELFNESYKDIHKQYKHNCAVYHSRSLLGYTTFVKLNGSQEVAQLFAKYNDGNKESELDLVALRKSLSLVRAHASIYSSSIALPYNMGMMLSEEISEEVSLIIKEILDGFDVVIYKSYIN